MSLTDWIKLSRYWEKTLLEPAEAEIVPRSIYRSALAICAAAIMITSPLGVTPAEIFLGLGVFLLLIRPARLSWQRWKTLPAYFLPMLGFVIWSLLSAFLSADPATSLLNLKKLVLFLIPLVILLGLENAAQSRWTCRMLFVTMGISAAVAILQFPNYHNMLNRIHGFMGHHMTFAGQLSLVLTVMVAYLVSRNQWRSRSNLLFFLLFLLGMTALTLTLTRSAWLGFFAGAVVVLLLLRPRLALLLPVLAATVFLLSPGFIQNRFEHFFDVKEAGNAARLDMWRTGIRIVEDRPVFGVGPVMIPQERRNYGANPNISDDFYMHLHNNIVQIAAERGIPTLIFWFWLLGSIVTGNFLFYWRRRQESREVLFYPVMALGAVVCLFVSGLFEYNFGDSEVLILFLALIGLASLVQKRAPVEPAHETP